ncbi:hypothetical protein PMAYCL1PPCAC_02691, partial [Pristionchus mayeri]
PLSASPFRSFPAQFSLTQLTSDMDAIREKIANALRIEDKKLIRQFLAEVIGTFFLVFIGTSANVQQAVAVGGNSTSAHIAWGIGFMFAVLMAASVSGAHLNPAISFTQMLLGNISIPSMVVYWAAQFIGAFLGAAATYFGHHDDLWTIDHGNRMVGGTTGTAGLFATYPSPHMSVWGSLLDQIIGTAILSGLICCITDKRHKIHSAAVPVLAGAIMTMVAMTFGANGGFAINPARDLGPRLWCLIAGYGWESFSANSYYFWIPLVGPMIGAVVGALIYKFFVGLHGGRDSLNVTNESYEGNVRGVPHFTSSSPGGRPYGEAQKTAQGYNVSIGVHQ